MSEKAEPRLLTDQEFDALLRRGRLGWRLFVALWIFSVSAVLSIVLLQPSDMVVGLILGALGMLILLAVALQIMIRCPACRASLGLQKSLGLPTVCKRCGTSLVRHG